MSTLTTLQIAMAILAISWLAILAILAKRLLNRYKEHTVIAISPPNNFRGKNIPNPKIPMTTTTPAVPVNTPKPEPQPSIATWGDFINEPPQEETIYKP